MGVRSRFDDFVSRTSLRFASRRQRQYNVGILKEDKVDDVVSTANFNTSFKRTCELTKLLDKLQEDVENVEKVQSKILTTVFQGKESWEELDTLRTSIQAKTERARTLLTELKNSPASTRNVTFIDARKNQYNSITNRFMEIKVQYQNIQTKFEEDRKARLQRVCEITETELSEEEKEELLKSGNLTMFGNIFASQDQAKDMYAAADMRHKEICKLEQSLVDLHALFQDMVESMQDQQIKLDQIGQHVDDTVVCVTSGRKNLQGAEEHMRKNRRLKLGIGGALLIVVIVIGLVVCLCLL